MQKSAVEVTLTSLATLIVLVILVGLANMIPVQNVYLSKILDFVNTYMLVIILFTLFFFVAEVLYAFGLPFNIVGVIFYSYGGYLITFFIFKIFYLIESFMSVEIFSVVKNLEQTVCIAVFFIVLVVGLSRIILKKKEVSSADSKVTWRDVWNEFKSGINNLSKKFREKTSAKKPEEKSEMKKEDKKQKKKKKI